MTDAGNVIKKNDRSKTALIILDMLNTFNFPEGEMLLPRARQAAASIQKLKQKCRSRGMAVIYVNDNFGQWLSSREKLIKKCTERNCKGQDIAKMLMPDDEDYFILKPMHSGFYLTPLERLLHELKCEELIITGIAGNICVLFTAHDAHMRGFKVNVPQDCFASNTEIDDQFVEHQLGHVFGFNLNPADSY